MTGATGNIYLGLHEFQDMGFLLHFLRPADTFLDIGSNVGSYTVLAAKVIGSRVVALEPAAEAFDWLKLNLALNEISEQVTCIQAAASDQNGTVGFTVGLDTTNRVTTHSDKARDVKAVKVDSLFFETEARQVVPSLIKIDVEGYERAVLKGMESLLGNSALKAMIIEVNDSSSLFGYGREEMFNYLSKFNFRPSTYDPFTRRLEIVKDSTRPRSGNLIFVKDSNSVQSRVLDGPPFEVWGEKI